MRKVPLTVIYMVPYLTLLGAVRGRVFGNPLLRAADPSVLFYKGMYYSVSSSCPHETPGPVICLLVSPRLPDLGKVSPHVIFHGPATGPNSADFWAPQIDLLDGKIYVYYAAGSMPGLNDHKLFALVPGSGEDLTQPWTEAPTGVPHGALVPNWKSVWAIDPDVYTAGDHKPYLLYACRQDNSSSFQRKEQAICLSAMSDPLHLTGQTVSLSYPTQACERRTLPTQEGPFRFVHDGVDYILYSASFSSTADDYSEALLFNDHPPQPDGKGNPLTNPASWLKQGPVFDGHHTSYGTASNVLVPSRDGTKIWNVYDGTDCWKDCPLFQGKTWRNRSDRVQKVGLSATGSLVMGYPVDIVNLDHIGVTVPLAYPSEDGRGSSTVPARGASFGDAAENRPTEGRPVGSWKSSAVDAISNASLERDQLNRSFYGASPNSQDYVLYTQVKLVESKAGTQPARFGDYGAYVDRQNYFMAMIDVSFLPRSKLPADGRHGGRRGPGVGELRFAGGFRSAAD